ncbi:MAG TPA: D-2-hydroxyacid dehydrogenase [Paenalcaligenes hominis]|uniref:D-2-hydroxyacid dehydrogenase n=1 Tax=Paenalcaligenes hominis TaxID=643674 RepID=A0A9D3ABC9_9BURK|nr:D-2-hydroxyacid dehydrogenase [Paenalcaligenes hominis]
MKIVFLDRQSLAPTVQLNRPKKAHEWHEFDQTNASDLLARCAQAEIIISNKVPLGAELLRQLPQLKLIAIPATGFNHVDVAVCQELGIQVSNVPNYATTTVPEHCLALIFALQRHVLDYHRSVAAGRWQQSNQFCYFDYPIRDLTGSTLGIVGAGSIGQALATKAQALGLKVIFAGRKNGTTQHHQVPFTDFLAQSDVISLHCPLNAQTHHLLGEPEFALMQKQPLIINTARGGLIDPLALAQALQHHQIRGAGIDVCETEPPAADHPYMRLMGQPNFIMTPHVAWASFQAMQHVADVVINIINAYSEGIVLNEVVSA